MKMKIIFSFLVLMFGLFSANLFAARSYKMELKNIVQINENELRFDVYLTNTSSTPAVDWIAVDGIQLQVTFNNLMLNGGALTKGLGYVTGTSDLEPLAIQIVPTNSNVTVNNSGNASLQTQIQFVSSPTGIGSYLPYLADNTPVRIGTFRARVMTTISTTTQTNYASVLPNLQLKASGCILLWTNVDYNLNGDFKYTRNDPYDYLITSQTLVSPSLSDQSLGANRSLYSYAYTGTGNYSSATNWNTSVASGTPSYNVVPTGTPNISIGKLSNSPVVPIPAAVLGACTVDVSKTVGDVTINSGSQLTLNSGITTTAANLYINSNAASGTGTFVDMNPLGGLTVSGATNVQQYLPMGRNWYISSPVDAAPTSIVTGTTGNSLWNYTEANSGTVLWNPITSSTGGNFGVTTGYVANVAASGNLQFTGTLNTGDLTTATLTRTGTVSKGFNLVGNPYPSYLNWISAVASSNTGTSNIEPTMWYRSQNPSSTYVFDTFIADGKGGGIGTSNYSGNVLFPVTGFIPPMQAFWVRVASAGTGTLAFDNSMRSHLDQSVTTNRLKAPAVASGSTTLPLMRLQVSNGINSDEAIVYFNNNATDGFDVYDAEKMSNNDDAIPEIYTLAGTEKVVINGMKSVYKNEELPLGFNTRKENTFTIKATELSNFEDGTQIILKDKLLNTEQELEKNTAYTFSSEVTNNTNRFSIVFKSTGFTTGLNNNSNGSESVLIYRNQNGLITVNRANAFGEGTVTVCNALGQLLTSISTTGTVTVVNKNFVPGIYLVKVNLAGKNTTQKVIIN